MSFAVYDLFQFDRRSVAAMEQLLTGFELPFWAVLLGYLLVTPLLPILVIAPVCERRDLPIHPKEGQFYTFIYGDIALALTAASLTSVNQGGNYLPVHTWWVAAVGVVTVLAAIAMTVAEYRDAVAGKPFAYAPRAVLSPTKLYHNLVLYGGYAWLLVMLLTEAILVVTRIGDTATKLSGALLLVCGLVFAGVWAWTMFLDEQSTPVEKQRRAEKAHVADWGCR